MLLLVILFDALLDALTSDAVVVLEEAGVEDVSEVAAFFGVAEEL